MQKLLHFPIFRSIKPQQLTRKSTFTSLPNNALENSNISDEVIAVINSVHPVGPALVKLAPFLNRQVVISVLQLEKDPRICFRFFVWSAKRARFRSWASHNMIIDMLLSGRDRNSFDLYWSVLDELMNAKLPVPEDAFVVLIMGYWRLGKVEKAVETFGKMKEYMCEPSLAAYNVILHILVEKGVILLAKAVYNMIVKLNIRMDFDTFSVLINGLCQNGMMLAAQNLLDEMVHRGISPNKTVYTSMISGFCKAKMLHDAQRLFNSMKSSGCRPDSVTYNALLGGFCKCGQIDEAFMLFNSLKNEGHTVRIREWSCLIDGLIRAKRLSEAEELFQKVFDVDLVPDVVLYTIMMRGLSEAGRMEDATNLLRDMMGKGVMPDTQCYNVLINGFCDIGLLDQARSLKLEISQNDQFPNTCTYSILICGLCRNGLLREAQQIFDEMEKLGCSPSAVTFNALIDGLCKAGKLNEAQNVFYKMEVQKPSLLLRLRLSQGDDHGHDTTSSLQKRVEEYVNSGEFLKAYKLLMQLSDSVVPNIKTYNILINGMCKVGEVDSAVILFRVLQEKRHIPDSVTYATLMNGLQRVDREREAYALFDDMIEKKRKPSLSVYRTLITWSCRRRKTPDAFSLRLKYIGSRSGWQHKGLKLAEEYFQKGELDKAVRSLLEMDFKFADADSAFYNIWLVGLCEAERVDAAFMIFSILEEYKVVVSAPVCVKLIYGLCSERKLNEATDIFLYTMEKGYRLMPSVCNRLLKDLLNSKDTDIDAFKLIERMISVGYDVNNYLHRSTKSLLRRHDSLRRVENALAI